MPKAILLNLVTLVSVLTGSQAAVKNPHHSRQVPAVSIEKPVIDVGQVQQGKEITTSFQVKNTGTQDLLISEVQPSCGCTLVSFDRIIKPGQSGSVKVSIDSRRLNGAFEKEIGFVSNDPSRRTLKFRVTGEVQSSVSVTPDDFVHVDELSKGSSIKRTLRLSSADARFAPELEDSTESFVHASLASSKAGYALSIEITGDAPQGFIHARLIVRTGLEREPELEIPVTAFVSTKTLKPARLATGK